MFLKVRAEQEEQVFSGNLSGSDEIPPTKSNATGSAKFRVNDNAKIAYWVSITGLKKITKADIHSLGQSEKPVVILTNGKLAKENESPLIIKLSGNITKNDLIGTLKGKKISELVSLMANGSSYIDTHTQKYPKGAIRAVIHSGDIDMERM